MTFTRAAAMVSGGALLVAWFAAAGSAPEQDLMPAGERPQSVPTSGPGSLAAEVEQQAVRLRERLAQAPMPDAQPRNPFVFGQPRAARPRAVASPAIVQPAADTGAPAVTPAPSLVLMGIAEQPSFEGIHRTAVIGGAGDELFIVMEGQSFGDRYKVKTIGVDAIELEDTLTGGFRRLALR
jgi:hypothetical protein